METPEAGRCLMQFLGNREEMTQGHPWSISQLLRKACAAPVSFPTPLPKPSLGDTDSGSTARAPGSPAALPGHQGHQQHCQGTGATSSTLSVPGPPADGSLTSRRPGKPASAAPELNNWVQSQNILQKGFFTIAGQPGLREEYNRFLSFQQKLDTV